MALVSWACAARLYLGWVVSKDPKLAKQLRIEEQDERAVYINNFAKAKAFDFLHFGSSLPTHSLWHGCPLIVLLGVSVYVVDWVVYFVFHVKNPGDLADASWDGRKDDPRA